MHIDEIIEERCFGSSNKTVYVCWTSRPIWAWEGQLGLAVTMQDAGVSGAGPEPVVMPLMLCDSWLLHFAFHIAKCL